MNAQRFLKLVGYNRDWFSYISHRWRHANGEMLTFRLRNGQTIRLSPDGRFVLNEIYLDHVYDVTGVDLAKCRTVLDLGANVGVFALYAASRAPQATVYCFEPASDTFQTLSHNITANHTPAKLFKFAVSSTPGPASLGLDAISVGRSLGSRSTRSEMIECVTLTKVFEMTGVDRFDFVKIDVEGAEAGIMETCTNDQLRRMGAISMEWHYSIDQMQGLIHRLRSIGFHAESQVLDGKMRYLKARQNP